MNQEHQSAAKAASVLGIEVGALYRYARSGRIRGIKMGKAWRFAELEVQGVLEEQREAAVSHRIEPTLLPDILRRALAESQGQSGLSSGGAEMSYEDVDAASDQLAQRLLVSGVIPGDRAVIVLLGNSVEFVVSCFAIWKAGCIVVPEDPATKGERLRHILQDCAPQAIVADQPPPAGWMPDATIWTKCVWFMCAGGERRVQA